METLTEAQQELYDWLVGYIRQNQHSPSIRQMMTAMELKSPAPVQSRLEHLRTKGYIDWTGGRARTIRLIRADVPGVPIKGAIAAGGLVESFQDIEGVDHLDFSNLLLNPQFYALRVRGHSMIDALIDDGDVVIMQPSSDPKALKNGTIVAAHVNGQTTLKYFHRKGSKVTLQPGNASPEYKPIEISASQVDVQGILVGVWRSRL